MHLSLSFLETSRLSVLLRIGFLSAAALNLSPAAATEISPLNPAQAVEQSYPEALVKKQSPDIVPKAILNNIFVQDGLRPGLTINYEFSKKIVRRELDDLDDRPNLDDSEIDFVDLEEQDRDDSDAELAQELKRRQAPPTPQARTVYISVNTCTQPEYSAKSDRNNPPQLTLWVSTSEKNKAPGPKSHDATTKQIPLVEGYAKYTMQTKNDIYLGVSAGNVKIEDDGIWTYLITASVDKLYHTYHNSSLNLFMIDSDPNAALLITKNLSNTVPDDESQKAMIKRGPRLSIFVHEKNNTAINGLHHSYCGLNQLASIPGFNQVPAEVGLETGLTTYSGSSVEQQFYIPNLNATSTYYGILANPSHTGKPIAGGGGGVFAAMTFHTKAQANCAVIFNLTFCSSIAYAVPANPDRYPDLTKLTELYDSTTEEKYKKFNYSLQQIPCNTTATAQYSLNKTCDDCAAAYKKWLCAVSIPRCADWTPHPVKNNQSFLQQRNAAQMPIAATPDIAPVDNAHLLGFLATNSSRNNNTIAEKIRPGPYAEILPCRDLCYEIVRSCPAAFGFGCPLAGRGLESGYGQRGNMNGGVACSEPGAVFGLSGATRAMTPGALGLMTWFAGIAAAVMLL